MDRHSHDNERKQIVFDKSLQGTGNEMHSSAFRRRSGVIALIIGAPVLSKKKNKQCSEGGGISFSVSQRDADDWACWSLDAATGLTC